MNKMVVGVVKEVNRNGIVLCNKNQGAKFSERHFNTGNGYKAIG